MYKFLTFVFAALLAYGVFAGAADGLVAFLDVDLGGLGFSVSEAAQGDKINFKDGLASAKSNFKSIGMDIGG